MQVLISLPFFFTSQIFRSLSPLFCTLISINIQKLYNSWTIITIFITIILNFNAIHKDDLGSFIKFKFSIHTYDTSSVYLMIFMIMIPNCLISWIFFWDCWLCFMDYDNSIVYFSYKVIFYWHNYKAFFLNRMVSMVELKADRNE